VHPKYIAIALEAAAAAGYDQNDRPKFGHDLPGMRHSTLKPIDSSNITKLVHIWTYQTNAGAPADTPGSPAPGPSEVCNGVMGGRSRGGRGGGGGNSTVGITKSLRADKQKTGRPNMGGSLAANAGFAPPEQH